MGTLIVCVESDAWHKVVCSHVRTAIEELASSLCFEGQWGTFSYSFTFGTDINPSCWLFLLFKNTEIYYVCLYSNFRLSLTNPLLFHFPYRFKRYWFCIVCFYLFDFEWIWSVFVLVGSDNVGFCGVKTDSFIY